MDVTPLVKSGQQIIQSYADGRFRVSGVVHEGAAIVFPDAVHPWSVSGSFDALTLGSFDLLLAQAEDVDVVLLGCGARMQFLPTALRASLKDAGVRSIDVMDTGAACRTYNVLMAEGRRVVAALLPVS